MLLILLAWTLTAAAQCAGTSAHLPIPDSERFVPPDEHAESITFDPPPLRPIHPSVKTFQRGIALGLHSQDPAFDYEPLLREIRQAGADWVSLFFSLEVSSIDAVDIKVPRGVSTQLQIGAQATAAARRVGLKPMIFPIILLVNPGEGQWRGVLEPADRSQFHRNYRRMMINLARAAEEWGAAGFVVGSELNSLESDEEQWRRTVAAIRMCFGGQILYSANWDHYEHVGFWDALDAIAISGYYELSDTADATLEQLTGAWVQLRDQLLSWRRSQGLTQSIIFSEIGYPNQEGCSMYPWDYTRRTTPAPREQARCYEAFMRAWSGVAELGGVFFYNWWEDPGDSNDPGYSPRGKPAEGLIRLWYAAAEGGDRHLTAR